MNKPFISIIIPAKNVQSTIEKCLNSILNLNYPNYEVIVINDGSTDETEKILTRYPNIQIINTKGVGPSKARNMGLKIAKGEFVAFTDADCIVDKEWLNELMRGFINENIAGVGGSQISPADESEFGRIVQEFLNTFGFISDYVKKGSDIKPTNHNPSCNAIYRKSVLIDLGGFLENLWPGEDVELDYRIRRRGYKLVFNPQAVVYHYRPCGIKDFLKMMFRYGKAQGYLVKRYGFFRRIHFVPVFFLLLICIFFYNPNFFIPIFILLALLIFINSLIRVKNPFIILGLFIISFISWNLGFLKGIFKK